MIVVGIIWIGACVAAPIILLWGSLDLLFGANSLTMNRAMGVAGLSIVLAVGVVSIAATWDDVRPRKRSKP